MEKVALGVRGSLARRLERVSSTHGPGYLDYLLETHVPDPDSSTADGRFPAAQPVPATEWVPKIAVDDSTKSIEIDVGSQVVVVNLSDFYKPRDAAQLFGGPATDATSNGAASGLDLLASTANMYRNGPGGGASAAKQPQKLTCALCQTRCSSRIALRAHYGTAHGQQLHECRRCGQAFLRRRELDQHDCHQADPKAVVGAHQRDTAGQRVPPLVVRPPKGHRGRRLSADSSSDDDDGVPARPPAGARRPAPAPAAGPASASAAAAGKKRPDGKKEAYVCRVCQSKFRDPQSVLQHLKQFHREHAMKAWSKFQENLRTRQPGDVAGAAGAGRGRGSGPLGRQPARAPALAASAGGDSFAIKSVSGAPMKLKLSRSLQQQQQQQRKLHQTVDEDSRDYPVLPSEVPTVKPGQREPIYHQTQYKVYQPPEPQPNPPPSPPADAGPTPNHPSPGYVTCGVCGGTKYYQFTDKCRLYHSYACESCRKFIQRLPINQPVQCIMGLGQCHIPVLVPRNVQDSRCRACWLKKSLLAFNMDQTLHDQLRHCLPPSVRSTVPTHANKPYKETGVCERDNLD